MSQIQANPKAKLIGFLRTVAPFSVVDQGIALASNGSVAECSKSGNKIHGVVRANDNNTETVSLDLVSAHSIEAACSCSTQEQMSEQWCAHAVSLLYRANELGFFDPHSGFPARESTYRMNTSSPREIAAAIREFKTRESIEWEERVFSPEVKILLDVSSDRLGIRVLFDNEEQLPALFEGLARESTRTVDNLLLDSLEEHGSWDDSSRMWFVNSSNGIAIILGLLQEFHDIKSLHSNKKIRFSKNPIHAKLKMTWLDNGLELLMSWLLAEGKEVPKVGELLGTGPFWTFIDDTLFRIAPSAARIAAIFTYSSSLMLPRSQVAPILEVLELEPLDEDLIEIVNVNLRPKTEIHPPIPTLELYRGEKPSEHFSSNSEIQVQASLDFEYPDPPKDKNLVYLPDRERERECAESLQSGGFEEQATKNTFLIRGDSALDFISEGAKLLPEQWRIVGLEALRKSIRFSELSFRVTLSDATTQSDGETLAPSTNSETKSSWFDCHLSLLQNNSNVPVSMIFKNLASEGDRWVRLDSGSYAKVPGGSLRELKSTLGILDPSFKLSNSIKARLSTAQAIGLCRINDSQFQVTVDKKLKALARKLESFEGIESVTIGKGFHGKLRPYQKEGVNWLNFLHEFDLGGILADEMGLGKTVQALALLSYFKNRKIKGKSEAKPSIVIAPTSVITNWAYEAKRFVPDLKVLLLHGPGRKKQFPTIPQHDLIVTSYALLRLDRYELEKYQFRYVILDEAQNIKNYQTATTLAAKGLKASARLALSGTPTENRPLELWSIMDFLMPGYLGSMEFFKTYIEKPILDAGPNSEVTKYLRRKTRPFLLRRTKNEVEKDLPPKLESVLHVAMADSQRDLYLQILEEVRPKVFGAVKDRGIRGASISILTALLRLRQICNHPNSIEHLKNAPGYESGKFNLLKDLTEEALDAGRKILIFGQFREMNAITRRWLDEKGVSYLYLDGATKNRQGLIDEFNSNEKVRLFLISLKAGGTGLNLMSADTVIIYDPWWNPAVESQAVDRAHRIGQTKTVNVYRLVTEHSVEQKIMGLKERKSKIAEALINETGFSTLQLTKTDLEHLFSPPPINGEELEKSRAS